MTEEGQALQKEVEGTTGNARRIAAAFAGGKAFIPFVTCGDPDLETTGRLIVAMAAAGADLIEIGIPFSDPTAEGPVIQDADLRALAAGTTTDDVFDLVEGLRPQVPIPLVFMTYANVIFSYGSERFMERASRAGIQGIIVPDAPFEEKDEFAQACRDFGIVQISMIAPTSHERIRMIAAQAEGFIYCISSLGVTGVRATIETDIAAMVSSVRAVSDVPCAIGFGISTPEQARTMARMADGVIVGSAIVKMCAQEGRDCVPAVGEYVSRMKAALA